MVNGDRFYMNKMFGRAIEHARELEEEANRRERSGSFKRATIEPDEHGGHRVIVEHHTTSEGLASGRGKDGRRIERSFSKPEDAARFLSSVLSGHEDGEGIGDTVRPYDPNPADNRGHEAADESQSFLARILGGGR